MITTQGIWGELAFMGIYIFGTQLCISSLLLMLVAGSVFGIWKSLIIIHISAVFASAGTFFLARYFLRSWVIFKWSHRWGTLAPQIEKNGFYYIFISRIVPTLPFCIINLMWGVSSAKTLDYFVATFLGKLPGSVVIVTAGHVLGCSLSGMHWSDTRIWKDPFVWFAFVISLIGVWQFPKLKRLKLRGQG